MKLFNKKVRSVVQLVRTLISKISNEGSTPSAPARLLVCSKRGGNTSLNKIENLAKA